MRRGMLNVLIGGRTAARGRSHGTGRRFVEQIESRLLLSASLELHPLAGTEPLEGTAEAGAAITGKLPSPNAAKGSKGGKGGTPASLSGNGYAVLASVDPAVTTGVVYSNIPPAPTCPSLPPAGR